MSLTCTVDATELAELRRDAARWRYAEDNLRVGNYYADNIGECWCDFEGLSGAEIDAAIAAEDAKHERV